jgi:hypothetical protein
MTVACRATVVDTLATNGAKEAAGTLPVSHKMKRHCVGVATLLPAFGPRKLRQTSLI